MSEQPGNKNGNFPNGKAREPYVDLNAVVSILSGGPVGMYIYIDHYFSLNFIDLLCVSFKSRRR